MIHLKRLVLSAAIALLLVCNPVAVRAANNIYSVRLAFTNNPVDGNSFTVNGSTRTFKTAVASPDTQITLGATPADTAANTLLHIQEHGFASLTPNVADPTNIVLIADAINFATTASYTGSWGGAVAGVQSLNLYTAQLPLSLLMPLTHRTNMANWMILGMRDYSSTNFPAGAGPLLHYLDDATAKTIAGANFFTGGNVLSNALQQWIGGYISNATLNAIQSITANLEQLLGPVSLTNTAPQIWYSDTDGAANEKQMQASQNASVWALRTFNDALTTSNDVMTVTRSGVVPVLISFTNGTVSIAKMTSPDIEGVATNITIGATNIWVQRLVSTGLTTVSNTGPTMELWDTDGGADQKRVQIFGPDGDFVVNFMTDAGGLLDNPFWLHRNGTGTSDVILGSANVAHVTLWAGGVGGLTQILGNSLLWGNASVYSMLGIGSTNVPGPTGLSTGIALTNATSEATADPVNGVALWAAGGELKGRQAGDGGNWRFKNVGSTVTGSGSDYNLTTSYADAGFGVAIALPLPSAGTYQIFGTVAIDEDAGNANDAISAKIYNSTDAADISGSERTISCLPAAKRGQITLCGPTLTVTGAKTLKIYVKNATAARGTIAAAQTSLGYVRLY